MHLEFGDFALDVGRFELRERGTPVKLEPKVFDVLRYLVLHRDRVVPREELLATLWPDEHVIDAVVTRCVYEIRRVLARDDSSSNPIETVRGRGYRFAHTVNVVDAEGTPERDEPFVGREREIRRLEASFARVAQGEGRVTLLVGEPGVGKTRITEELATRVRGSGHVVWMSRCHEDRGAPPFWLWTQIARRCVRESQDADVRRELGAAYRQLAALLPELADERETSEVGNPLHADAAHYRLFDAVTLLLRLVTAGRPHLLVLDDLHWADLPSLQLLGFVIAEIADRPVFVLGTCRDTDWLPDDPRKAVIDGFGRHANCERLPVAPLSAAAVDDYVTRRVGEQRPRLAGALHRLSEGNPFFMVEALRPVLLAPAGTRAALDLPDASRDVVRRRLASLDEDARALLQAAAVFGTDFEVGLLADAVGSDATRILDALQRALQARLLVAVPESAGRFRFAHGLIRETLYGEIPLARRGQLHARIALRLERVHPPPASELAHHFHRALPGGDAQKALRWTRAAGEAASLVYAHDAAVVHHRQALDALRALPGENPSVHQEILRALGSALHLSGRLDAAKSAFRQAATLARNAGDTPALALAAIGLRDCQPLRAVPDPTVEADLREALDRLPTTESRLRARVLSRLAAVRSVDARRKESELATELARDVDDPTVLAEVCSARLHALQGPDEIEQRLQVADRLIALSDAHRRPTWAWEGLLARHDAWLRRADVAAADAALAASGALAEQLHHPGMRLDHARLSAQRAICEGRYADAERQILRNAETAQRLSDPFGQFYFLVQMFWLLRDRGLIGTLGDQAERFIHARPWVERTARSTAALMYIEQGDRDAARRSFDYYARDGFAGVPYGEDYVSVFAQLAVVCADLGATEHAPGLYETLLPYADQNVVNGTSTCLGSVAHFLGVLARVLGRADAARAHFARAVAMNEALRLAPALVRTRLAYAELLAPDEPAQASTQRGSATSMAEAIGMVLPATP